MDDRKMYCLPEARGTGVARELMDEALKYAERFYGQCYLETLDNMTAAQKFYESCGFRRIEEPVVQTEHFSATSDISGISEASAERRETGERPMKTFVGRSPVFSI